MLYRFIVAGLVLMNMSACYAGDGRNNGIAVNDIQDVLQRVIDHRQLDAYFHADVLPERIPLLIVRHKTLTGIELEKFGRKAELAAKSDLLKEKKPYLEFSTLDIQEDHAFIKLS